MHERFFRVATVVLILLVAALFGQSYIDRMLFRRQRRDRLPRAATWLNPNARPSSFLSGYRRQWFRWSEHRRQPTRPIWKAKAFVSRPEPASFGMGPGTS